jgi:decaprenylphospho-beta-D-erythro-pentofuranosid-2-ulose 2-reductase
MLNALGIPQSLLLLGGTSDIALAVARRYAGRGSGLRVVLAARPSPRRSAAAAELTTLGCTVEEVDLDARDHASHAATVEAAFAGGDVDVAVLAFGVLGDPERDWSDPELALELAEVNFAAPVHLGVLLGLRMRAQAHGRIVALSSVAGERVRRSNFVYGSTKAGFDGFFLGLGEALREHGVHVLVVRPGFVRSKMTAGLSEAPLAVDADDVAAAVVEGVREDRELIWVPRPMRFVMSGLRHVPRPLFRRLPV